MLTMPFTHVRLEPSAEMLAALLVLERHVAVALARVVRLEQSELEEEMGATLEDKLSSMTRMRGKASGRGRGRVRRRVRIHLGERRGGWRRAATGEELARKLGVPAPHRPAARGAALSVVGPMRGSLASPQKSQFGPVSVSSPVLRAKTEVAC